MLILTSALLTNIQVIFTRRLFSLHLLLLLFTACNNISSRSEQNTDYEHPLTESNEEIAPKIAVTVIAEQDPNGIFWGLRDTVTGKLVLNYTYQEIRSFKDGFAIVQLDSKYGLIDKGGKVIIEPNYDSPEMEMKCGFMAFEFGYGPVVIFNANGKSVMPMVYGMTGILPCQKRITFGDDQYGMLNFDGDTILPFKFMDAYLLSGGFCVASKAVKSSHFNLYGLYDLNGKQVLPHVFERINDFHSGRAIVKKNGKYGVIDETGKELFYTEYGRIDEFQNNYAIVYTKSKDDEIKVGIIDRNGREVVPAIYQWFNNVYSFSEGMAAMAQNRKYGFVDKTGKVVIQFKYDKVESFKNGIAKVWVGWRYVGYINSKGEEIIPSNFEAMDQANLRRYYSKFVIGLKGSVQHVFDYSGKKIATLSFETIGEFNEHEKSFIVSRNDKWGTLDSNFQVKIPIEYESLEIIFSDKIAARKKGKIGFINHEGKLISSFDYDWISQFQGDYVNGLAIVGKKEKKGLINSYGKLIIPVRYDEIEDFSHGLAVVKRNKKYGFVNFKGKEIIPAIYDEANSYKGYTAEVTLKGETFQIDSLGNRVEEEDD